MAYFEGAGSVQGTEGDDTIVGLGTFYDPTTGTGQNDYLSGNGGNDRIYGGVGWNSLNGGFGDDYLDNSQATRSPNYSPASGLGTEGTLSGGPGNNTLIGGSIDERLEGALGHDLIWGNGGNDFLLVSAGADVVDLGSGNDTAWLYTYILTPYYGLGFDGGTIDAGGGHDTFFVIIPPINGVHPFADLLATRNPDGSIVVRLNPGDAGLTLRNFEQIDANLIFGNSVFDSNANSINFNALTTAQQSKLTANGTLDLYNALAGDDVVTLPDAANWVLGPGFVWDSLKTFYGNAGDDTVMGGDSSDRIAGGVGNDNIAGNGGSDKLYGGDGVDELVASLGDQPGDWDYLDGGAGRDTFFVNAGDVIAAFESIDDRIVFSTPYSVANMAVVLDGVTNHTTIYAFAEDRTIFQSIEIEQGVSPRALALRSYSGLYGSGALIENIPLSQAIFGFANDDAELIGGASSELTALFNKAIKAEIAKAFVDAGIDKVALPAFEDYVARKAAFEVARNTSAFLADVKILGKPVEFVASLHTIILKFIKGEYDGNTTAFWGDFGEAMFDFFLPKFGGTIFKLGTGLAVELITSALIKWGDAATAEALKLATAKTVTPTPGDDVVWFDAGGSWSFGSGDDIGIAGQSFGPPSGSNPFGMQQAASAGSRTIDGGDGVDTLVYENSGDLVIDLAAGTVTLPDGTDTLVSIENVGGGSGNDTIRGDAGANSLWGNGGNDRLDGAIGADRMFGGLGDDTYVVDNLGDTVVEDPGAGTDLVETALTGYVLPDNVENLRVIGNAGVVVSGNALANLMTGGPGNDRIDGGGGADTLIGGLGNDTFVVDNFGDTVTELPGEGTDTVQTALGSSTDYNALYYLPDNVENLVMTGSAQGAHGNALSNVITGSGGNDLIVLSGGAPFTLPAQGSDTVNAGGGDDYLFFGGSLDATDTINGGSGYDFVGLLGTYSGLVLGATSFSGVDRLAMYSSGNAATPYSYNITTHDGNVAAGQTLAVTAATLLANEVLTFNGSAETNGKFQVTGGRGADSLTGGAGADRFIGGLGADVLTGGAGNDVFQFNTAGDSTAGARDQILDFAAGDKLDLWFVDANASLGGNQKFDFIGANAFSNTAGQLRATEQSPGQWLVEGDVDGDGLADLAIAVTVSGGHLLGAGDFVL